MFAAALLAVAVLCAGESARAQSGATSQQKAISVGGTVRNAKGEPVENATVSIHGAAGTAPYETKSNAQGTFALSTLLAGRYLLKAEKLEIGRAHV